MKKLWIIAIVGIAGMVQTVRAQDSIGIGENYLTGERIVAKEYVFPEKIYDWSLIGSTGELILQLREVSNNGKRWTNDGKLVSWNLKEQKKNWSQRISYTEPVMLCSNLLLFHNNQGERMCFDVLSGGFKCSPKRPMVYLHPVSNVGIGYYSDSDTHRLEGIDLNNGHPLWKKKIKLQYGINDIHAVSDSTILVSCAGLHYLNLRNGTGWDYDAKTGIKDYSTSVGATVAGTIVGLLTGVYTVFYGYDVFGELCSNVLMENDRIYFADMERLSCLGDDGSVKWVREFARNTLSKSILFEHGTDTLIMVNLGYGYFNGNIKSYGFPFIEAYDKETGNPLYTCKIGVEDYPVRNFSLRDDSIVVLFRDKIARYSLTKGTYLVQQYFSDIATGELTSFMNYNACMQYGGRYIPLVVAYPERTALQGADKVFILDDELDVIDSIDNERIYYPIFTIGEYNFLSDDKEIVAVDCNGNETARIEGGYAAFVVENRMYILSIESLKEIDISGFFPDYEAETQTADDKSAVI